MILYYAMGGGLGHVTRSIAVLTQLCKYRDDVRCMVSSNHASIAKEYIPCPVDHIRVEEKLSRTSYLQFLDDYINRHKIHRIILDTFPWGIVGEWVNFRTDIPRSLIARDLKWDAYLDRVNGMHENFPENALTIEQVNKNYQIILNNNSNTESINSPIVLQLPMKDDRTEIKYAAFVVHSGNQAEQNILLKIARDLLADPTNPVTHIDTCFPEQNIYPAELYVSSYSHVISGAGYNMAAVASQAPTERKHILYPFERRFDNQLERYKKYTTERWFQNCGDIDDSPVCSISHWIEQQL